jgi:hypothetical protein
MKIDDEEPIDNISKALDITFDPSAREMDDPSKDLRQEAKKIKTENLDVDFAMARTHMKDLINNGMNALDGIMKVAEASDSPRAYEVAALILKTVSEINKDLIGIHEKNANIQKEKVTNITNNSIYVGSTTDLQNLINRERAHNKVIENGDKTE